MPRVARQETIDRVEGYYHVSNRVREGAVRFRAADKAFIFELFQEMEEFFMIEVISCFVLNDQYHLICYSPGNVLSAKEAAERYNAFYDGRKPELLTKGNTKACKKIAKQMVDISHFMRVFQQRLSCYINRNYKRKGALWADRFRCELLEGTEGSEWWLANGIGIKLG